MNTQLYLNGINFNKEPEISLVTLFALQEAHLLNVPFENLDIHYHKEIKLDVASIFEKVVLKARDGF